MPIFSRRWKRVIIVIYGILILCVAILLPLFVVFNDVRSPYRPAAVYLVDEICGGIPTNREPRGIYRNSAEAPSRHWRVALYDGARKHRLFFGVGGDDFRDAALNAHFTHRINSGDSAEAAILLGRLLSEMQTGTQLVEIAVLDHGRRGTPFLGRDPIQPIFYEAIAKTDVSQLTLRFYGCSVAEGEEGREFMNQLAASYGMKIAASRAPVTWNTSRLFRSSILDIPREDWVEVAPSSTAKE